MVCLTVKVGKCSSSADATGSVPILSRAKGHLRMELTLLAVQDLPGILLLHLLGAQSLVNDIPLDLEVTLSVVGDRLQKGRRSTARSGEDETHLTRTEETGKVGQEVFGLGGHGIDAEELEKPHDGHDELLDDGVGKRSNVDL